MHRIQSKPRILPVLWQWSIKNILVLPPGFLAEQIAHLPSCAFSMALYCSGVIPYVIFNLLLRSTARNFSLFFTLYALLYATRQAVHCDTGLPGRCVLRMGNSDKAFSALQTVHLCVVFTQSLKRGRFTASKTGHLLQRYMHRPVNQFTIQPVLSPRSRFIVVVNLTGTMLQQGVIHITFGRSNNQFELLMSAVVEVLAGMVIVKVVVEVLSAPKSITAMDLLP